MNVSYRFFSILAGVLLSGFGLVCTGHQDAFAATLSTSTKNVTGEVSGRMNDSISIMYREDAATGQEFEILFMVDETVDLIGRNDLKGFDVGDTVQATYTESVGQDENGNEFKERKLLSIKFLQPAVTESAETESTSDPALTSEQP